MIGPVNPSRPVGQLATTAAILLGGASVTALAALMVAFRSDLAPSVPALVLVVPVVAAGLAGGRLPALATAVVAAAAFNLAFISPYWTFKVAALEDLLALGVFLVVAIAVGTLVAAVADRRNLAEDRAKELGELNSQLMALHSERERLAEEATRASVLERVDEQRAALLRSVSHDLRTPLSSIRGVASDLLSNAQYDEATRRDLLVLVADEAERLDRLVANLLSLSRIEAGDLKPTQDGVALDELVDDVLRRLRRILRDLRVRNDIPRDLPQVRGDYTQLDLVISNLLENAARHAPPGSVLQLGARVETGRVRVWVDDDGPGVLPFERQRIFQPFQKGERGGSSGIGLATCKGIVEAHGGEIAVTAAPHAGARFTFTLPLSND